MLSRSTNLNLVAGVRLSRFIKILCVVSALALLAWFAYGAIVADEQVEIGENLDTVSWLPDEASNISFYRSYRFTAYEFDISEAGFERWSQWPVNDLSTPKKIARYLVRTEPESPAPSFDATDEQLIAYHRARQNQYAKITDGLYYEIEQSNGGGVWVGYDRQKGRVFYQSSPR